MNLRVIRVDKNGLPKEDSPFKTYNFQVGWYRRVKNPSLFRNL